MTESFLHYIWQQSLFNTKDLFADDGCRVEIIKPGAHNSGAGPDFFNAQIRIDGTLWAGNVEIHIHSSDWQRHNHQSDPAYDSCILHVVYKNDSPTLRMNGSGIPTIEIANRYSPYIWDNYLQLIGTQDWIACRPRLIEIDETVWNDTKQRMIAERLNQRCTQILIALRGNKDDWQETFYQYLSKNFGFQLNAVPFEMMARSLPSKIILKERKSLSSIEALMFGQAGMLEDEFSDDYSVQLQKEYRYLSKMYDLKSIPYSAWKFLRLRPVNFPTVRIAQLAALIYKSPILFSDIVNGISVQAIYEKFNITASDYWNNHYRLGLESVLKVKSIGSYSINNILINTCIPFIFAWGQYTGNIEAIARAYEFLREIPPEENNLITRWKETGLKVENAVDSQALLQLKVVHCSEKKCLTCNIGNILINNPQ